jgi:pimeloyl-ACP methyl ester carboxylesterase
MYPVLLLHGALGSKTQLDPLKAKLLAGGFNVYTLNFSGHSGEPFSDSFGIQTFAEDVKRFIDQRNLNKVNIFGYSMGGYVAVWMAAKYPKLVNRIVTLGTKFDWDPASAEKEIRKVNPEKIQEKIPAFARILESRHAPNDWKDLLGQTAVMMKQLGDTPLLNKDIFSEINHDVTILLGDHDDMADPQFSKDVSAWLPNGHYKTLENTHHPIERTDLNLLFKILEKRFSELKEA